MSPIEEKYQRMLDEMRPIIKEKGNEFSRQFMESMDAEDRMILSFAQKKVIGNLYRQWVEGDTYNPNRSSVIEGDNVRGENVGGGWQVYIQGKPVGSKCTRKETELIVAFMDQSFDDICCAIQEQEELTNILEDKPAKPQQEKKGMPF